MVDIPADSTTTATFDGNPLSGASFTGELETRGDRDWIKVDLIAGLTYDFYAHVQISSDPGNNDNDSVLNIFDGSGLVARRDDGGVHFNTVLIFTPAVSGTYFVEALELDGDTGTYTVEVAADTLTRHLLTVANDIYTGASGERILGGEGDDTITVGAGVDALGEQGDDVITGNGSDNFISGGTGIDTIHGGAGADSLFGDSGDDQIDGGAGVDVIFGGDGHDTIYGGDLSDVPGDTGDNQLHGGNGDDGVTGSAGNDLLWGDAGADVLVGYGGTDRLDGGTGADTMHGGAGDDIYFVDDIGDIVDESTIGPLESLPGDGVDKVYAAISFSLSDAAHVLGEVENLVLTGTADVDAAGNALANALTGNAGANRVSGLDGKDRLDGRGGNDHLLGGGDNDALLGGAGDDILDGGAGGDRLLGGTGADTFVFAAVADSVLSATGRDSILDFNRAEGDKVDLSAIDADGIADGMQHFAFLGTGSFTRHAGELRYVVQHGDVFLHGDTNGDGRVDFSIRFDNLASLQAGDFIL